MGGVVVGAPQEGEEAGEADGGGGGQDMGRDDAFPR